MKHLLLFFLLFLATVPARAVAPMEYFNTLVAGDSDAGFQDGAFDDARFHTPRAIVLDDTGKRLFVADTENNRIRVVYLDQDNRVETLAGTGAGEEKNGPLNESTFWAPSALAFLPGNRLVVYDEGGQELRLIHMNEKTVETLAKNIGSVWNMVYEPKKDRLYLSETLEDQLVLFDMKTRKQTILMGKDKAQVVPKAICLKGDEVFISNAMNSEVFEVEALSNTLGAVVSAKLTSIGKGKKIVEMAVMDDQIYALQEGEEPLAIIGKKYKPVRLTSAWDFYLTNVNPGYMGLIQPSSQMRWGFAASPSEKGKFYIAGCRLNDHSIISVKDYDFDDHWEAREANNGNRDITDFEYPEKKPSQTFRILLVGNSRVVTAPEVYQEDDNEGNKIDLNYRDEHSPRLNTMAKRLEFLLNTEAALDGLDEHFEVLTVGRPGLKLQFFINDQVPLYVQKYDIDLVLGLLAPTFEEEFDDYYYKPLDADGIPSNDLDPEYISKSWKEKTHPTGAAERLLYNCQKLKLVDMGRTQPNFHFFQELLLSGNTEIRDDLIELIGKPFQVFNRKMAGFKTSAGNRPQFALFFVPTPDCDQMGKYESFWSDLCTRNNLNLLDLTKPYEDLKIAYYPTTQACCHRHYTAYGNELIARLLTHYLPLQGWIPFKPAH